MLKVEWLKCRHKSGDLLVIFYKYKYGALKIGCFYGYFEEYFAPYFLVAIPYTLNMIFQCISRKPEGTVGIPQRLRRFLSFPRDAE